MSCELQLGYSLGSDYFLLDKLVCNDDICMMKRLPGFSARKFLMRVMEVDRKRAIT